MGALAVKPTARPASDRKGYPTTLPFVSDQVETIFQRPIGEFGSTGLRISKEQGGILARKAISNVQDMMLFSLEGDKLVESFREKLKLPGPIVALSKDGGSRFAVLHRNRIHIYEYSPEKGEYSKLCHLSKGIRVTDESIGGRGDEFVGAYAPTSLGAFTLFKLQPARGGRAKPKKVWNKWQTMIGEVTILPNSDDKRVLVAAPRNGGQVIASFFKEAKGDSHLEGACVCSLPKEVHDINVFKDGEQLMVQAVVSDRWGISLAYGKMDGRPYLGRGSRAQRVDLESLGLSTFDRPKAVFLPEIGACAIWGRGFRDDNHDLNIVPVGGYLDSDREVFTLPHDREISAIDFDAERNLLAVGDRKGRLSLVQLKAKQNQQ